MAAWRRTCWMVLGLPWLLAAAPASGPATGPATGPAVVPAVVPVKGKVGKPVPLFNSKDLIGWTWHSSTASTKIEDVWTVKDGALHSAAGSTGFIDTDKEYQNFVLTIEQRHMPAATTRANGGIFICINGPEKQWPNAIQIQGMFGSVGDLLNQNAGMKKMTTDPARTATVGGNVVATKINKGVEKPAGEWDTVVITMENGNLSVTVNGKVQNTATDVSPAQGKIGLQAEGFEMEFRKVELAAIDSN